MVFASYYTPDSKQIFFFHYYNVYIVFIKYSLAMGLAFIYYYEKNVKIILIIKLKVIIFLLLKSGYELGPT